MRENAFCMVRIPPSSQATRAGFIEIRGEKNPSHMESHTKCISGLIICAAIDIIYVTNGRRGGGRGEVYECSRECSREMGVIMGRGGGGGGGL